MLKQEQIQVQFMVSDKKSWTTSTFPLSEEISQKGWEAALKSVVRESSHKNAALVSTLDQSSGMHVLTDPLSQET